MYILSISSISMYSIYRMERDSRLPRGAANRQTLQLGFRLSSLPTNSFERNVGYKPSEGIGESRKKWRKRRWSNDCCVKGNHSTSRCNSLMRAGIIQCSEKCWYIARRQHERHADYYWCVEHKKPIEPSTIFIIYTYTSSDLAAEVDVYFSVSGKFHFSGCWIQSLPITGSYLITKLLNAVLRM